MTGISGLHHGDPIRIRHPELPMLVPATYVGFTGGSTAMVRLEGTGALVHVPREMIER